MAARLRIADSIAGALDIGLSSASAASEAGPASEALAASEAISGVPLLGFGSAATLRAAAFNSTPEESRRWRAMVEAQAVATGPRGERSRATRPRSRGERTSSGTRRTLRPDRRYATGSDQRTRDETPQSAESPGPGRLERSRRTLTSALSSWISAVSSACSA